MSRCFCFPVYSTQCISNRKVEWVSKITTPFCASRSRESSAVVWPADGYPVSCVTKIKLLAPTYPNTSFERRGGEARHFLSDTEQRLGQSISSVPRKESEQRWRMKCEQGSRLRRVSDTRAVITVLLEILIFSSSSAIPRLGQIFARRL